MTYAVQQSREALGSRLRDLRKESGLTARAFARAVNWVPSKVSKLERGRQTPTESDIRTWCRQCRAENQTADLIASLRNIEAAYLEWRRMRLPHRQRQSIAWESGTKLMRWYEPVLVPGLLQTPEYAEAVLGRVQDFYHGSRDDLPDGLAARLERQQVLYRGDHRFHFILAEQALHTTVGNDDIMFGQLDRLLIAMSLPRVVIGVIPSDAQFIVPLSNFCMFDTKRVLVETITAELTITQPGELVLYEKTFQTLARQALVGDRARVLIRTAMAQRREPLRNGPEA
ncbi:helix-turn-helix transcriptional regulator [Nocardia sp. CDC159]|uniref:Helix-turn-helix transcriptional regulator n=1 Tax=Nocardia pulmonis TaxID=2951408 RepID=A0A9X2ED36_9NOCA|nr:MULTISPECIES: helix-turn-helix transcriptional regulator [Nocardia]MCM6778131.1 helix-turn-helix transcriptional regulator [Nocardia pulmonis]MCM6791020.1 helix-turn-helix transcriptional regulator [Nocardia sp. CDC159]